jgi:hypothetical protein
VRESPIHHFPCSGVQHRQRLLASVQITSYNLHLGLLRSEHCWGEHRTVYSGRSEAGVVMASIRSSEYSPAKTLISFTAEYTCLDLRLEQRMTETVIAIPTHLPSIGARLKGRAKGALICAVFGSLWMFWTAAFAPARTASLAVVALMTILISGWAMSRVRRARRYQDSDADRKRWASIAPLFWIDTAVEWMLGAGAVIVLAHLGRYPLIPQFLGVIIGLHFLPLAKILSARRYYIMGTAIVVCVLASLLVPEGNIRTVIACAGIGLPMWVTAAAILSQD